MSEHKHWNQKGTAPRVRLGGGPFIDPVTKAQLDLWQAEGMSYGEIIDRLTTFAAFSGFNPNSLAVKPKTPRAVKPEGSTIGRHENVQSAAQSNPSDKSTQ
jgi:hypothetical protein